MSRFHGNVGYGIDTEVEQDVWEKVIEEHEYYGDVSYNRMAIEQNKSINGSISVTHTINIVADPFAFENMYNIMYVEYMGVKWQVSAIEVHRPRLRLSLGGRYND